MQNDLQSVADDLLKLKISIAPYEERIETLKSIFADATNNAGEGLTFTSSFGAVSTRMGSVKKSKGFIPQLNVAGWEKLNDEMKAQLRLAGVVVEVEEFSRESKPAVTVKPSTAALKAAA